jgi:hypothetical protein
MTEHYTPVEPAIYLYTLTINVTGAINSDAPEDKTKELLLEALSEKYADNIELLEFRQATPSEIESLKEFYDFDAEDINTTVN